MKRYALPLMLLLAMGYASAYIIYDASPSVSLSSWWNISTSKYLANYSQILDVNETILNTTIESYITSVTYNASALGVISGTLDYGDVNSIKYLNDGLNISVSEDLGADPLTIDINFTGVIDFNQVLLNVFYDGSTAHNINIGIWDCSSSYDYGYGSFTAHDDYVNILVNILDSSSHICSGEVSVRLTHVENGNSAHDFYVDYVALLSGFTGITTNSHDSLQDRQDWDNNHPLYADNLTDHESRIITLEATGGGGSSVEWEQINGVITSNASITNGDINITGKITMVDDDGDDGLRIEVSTNQPHLFLDGASQLRIYGSPNVGNTYIQLRNNLTDGTIDDVKIYFYANHTQTGWIGYDQSSGNMAVWSPDFRGNGQAFVPSEHNQIGLGRGARAWLDIYYSGSLTDTNPDLAERFYIENNKSILQTGLGINSDGSLNISNANPYLYYKDENNTYADIGEATIDNALKIEMLSKAVKRLYVRLCGKYPSLPECDKELWEIIKNDWEVS